MGLGFSPVSWRWLTHVEALLAQGFPAYKQLQQYADWGESSSFDTMRAVQLLPPRRRACVFEQAGNAMNTNMVGIGMLYGLTVVSEAQPSRKREFGSIASGSSL